MTKLVNSLIIFLTAMVISSPAFSQEVEVHSPFEVRVFLKFMLEGVGKTDAEKVTLFSEAQQYIQNYRAQTVENIKVSNLEEAIEIENRNLPFWGNREYEIVHLRNSLRNSEILPPVNLEFENPQELERMKAYEALQKEVLRELLEPFVKSVSETRNAPLEMSAFSAMIEANPLGLDYVTLVSLLASQNIPGESKLELAKGFEKIIISKMNQFDDVAKSVAQSQKIEAQNFEGIQRFMEIILEGYFQRLPDKYKLRMVNDLLDRPSTSDPMEIFKVLIMNSTPDFQKVIQVIARKRGVPAELSEIFQVLESKGKPVPAPVVREIIMNDPDVQRGKYEFKEGSLKQIGAVGTVAEIWLGELTEQSRLKNGFPHSKIVVRFNKPGVESSINDGRSTMEAVAEVVDKDPVLIKNSFPSLSEVLEAAYKNMYGDLDLNAAVEKQRAGEKNYVKQLNIKHNGVNVLIDFRVPFIGDSSKDSNILVIERVSGDKFTNFNKLNPMAGKQTALGLRRLWLEEAIFKSGNNHQDLHQGNMMIRMLSKPDAKENLHVEVNILDWGMSGFMTPKEQFAFIALAVSSLLEGPRTVMKALWKVKEDAGRLTLSELVGKVKKIMSSNVSAAKAANTPPEWLLWGIEEKVRFPDSFAGVGRGGETVLAVLETANLSSKEIDRADLKVALKHLLRVVISIVRYSPTFVKDIPSILVNKGKRFFSKKTDNTNALTIVQKRAKCLGFLNSLL